jgi:hypothetical protein
MATLNGINFKELVEGSGKVEITDQGTAQRRLLCAWTDSIALALAFYGYVGVNGRGALVISLPQQWPEFPALWVTKVTREPFGKPTGLNAWTSAILTVEYGTRPYDPTDLIEESLDSDGEVFNIPAEDCSFGDDGGSDDGFSGSGSDFPEDDGGGGGGGSPPAATPTNDQQLTMSLVKYTLTVHRMPYLPLQLINGFTNKVNSASFKGASPGHMLLDAWSASRKTTSFGAQSWDVSFKFIWSPSYDMRSAFDSKTNSFRLLTIGGAGYKYGSADFNQMFATQ